MDKFEQEPTVVGLQTTEAVAGRPMGEPGRSFNNPGFKTTMLGIGAAAAFFVSGALKRDLAYAGTIGLVNTPVESQSYGVYSEASPDTLPTDNSPESMRAFGRSLINSMPGFNATFRQPL